MIKKQKYSNFAKKAYLPCSNIETLLKYFQTKYQEDITRFKKLIQFSFKKVKTINSLR